MHAGRGSLVFGELPRSDLAIGVIVDGKRVERAILRAARPMLVSLHQHLVARAAVGA